MLKKELEVQAENLGLLADRRAARIRELEYSLTSVRDEIAGADEAATQGTRSLSKVREAIEAVIAMKHPMVDITLSPQRELHHMNDEGRDKLIAMVLSEPDELSLLRHLHRLAH